MGRINRKRKLSPSGSKARLVEDENGVCYGEITDEMGNRSRLSLGAMNLLQGLLMTVMRPVAQMVRPPVQRKLDFHTHIDVQATDDDECDDDYVLPCGQRSPLVKLEDIWRRDSFLDGWMTSRVKDISWLSTIDIHVNNNRSGNQLNSNFLGIEFDIGTSSASNSMSEETFREIITPAKCSTQFPIKNLPNELIMQIIDKMPMRDVLNVAQTCKQMNTLIECPEFWRHRLLKDFNCYSICLNRDHELCVSRETLKQSYNLVSKASDFEDEPDAAYEEILV